LNREDCCHSALRRIEREKRERKRKGEQRTVILKEGREKEKIGG
jgi:hypothetical protein